MAYIERLQESDEFDFWTGASESEIKQVEQELSIKLPSAYKQFLAECGSCNFADVNILGIAKDETSISYPVIETTVEMRKEANLEPEWLVLSYEVGEYLTLYQVSKTNSPTDASVFGAVVTYDDAENIVLGEKEQLFDSFKEFFDDFLELGL